MVDIVGPIVAIALIFGIYYLAYFIEARGKEKIVDQDVRLSEARTREKKLDVQLGILDYKKHEALITPKGVESDFKVIEDKRENKEDETRT